MEIESDSDAELQAAFERGDLKPGLSVPVQVIKRESVNNIPAIKQKLSDIKLEMNWIERLDMINDLAPLAPELKLQFEQSATESEVDSTDNDFKREMNFYRQAQAAVLEALPKLHKLNIPTQRPKDYFAEMAKSDDHMKKIREKLLSKQESLERSQKAKKLRELRKHGKKIHQEVLQQRQKEKKEMMEAVKKYRKGDKTSLDFLENNKGNKGGKKLSKKAVEEKKKYKESKYGYGGKKKRSKYNTAKSSADMSGFRRKPASNNRPGKSRRQNMKNRKKR